MVLELRFNLSCDQSDQKPKGLIKILLACSTNINTDKFEKPISIKFHDDMVTSLRYIKTFLIASFFDSLANCPTEERAVSGASLIGRCQRTLKNKNSG